MKEIKERFNAFIMTKGLRRTRQREVIVEAAFGTKEHYTAEELWEMARKLDRTASRATVYRTLALLVECGLLREIDLGKDVVCYDPNFLESPDHNHLICLFRARRLYFAATRVHADAQGDPHRGPVR